MNIQIYERVCIVYDLTEDPTTGALQTIQLTEDPTTGTLQTDQLWGPGLLLSTLIKPNFVRLPDCERE